MGIRVIHDFIDWFLDGQCGAFGRGGIIGGGGGILFQSISLKNGLCLYMSSMVSLIASNYGGKYSYILRVFFNPFPLPHQIARQRTASCCAGTLLRSSLFLG